MEKGELRVHEQTLQQVHEQTLQQECCSMDGEICKLRIHSIF